MIWHAFCIRQTMVLVVFGMGNHPIPAKTQGNKWFRQGNRQNASQKPPRFGGFGKRIFALSGGLKSFILSFIRIYSYKNIPGRIHKPCPRAARRAGRCWGARPGICHLTGSGLRVRNHVFHMMFYTVLHDFTSGFHSILHSFPYGSLNGFYMVPRRILRFYKSSTGISKTALRLGSARDRNRIFLHSFYIFCTH